MYASAPFERAATVTNLGTYSESGTLVGNFGVNYWTNRTRTINWTGVTWTVAASNWARGISVAAGDVIWFSVTNGAATNIHAHAEGTMP